MVGTSNLGTWSGQWDDEWFNSLVINDDLMVNQLGILLVIDVWWWLMMKFMTLVEDG
jgi:hypothetical protein